MYVRLCLREKHSNKMMIVLVGLRHEQARRPRRGKKQKDCFKWHRAIKHTLAERGLSDRDTKTVGTNQRRPFKRREKERTYICLVIESYTSSALGVIVYGSLVSMGTLICTKMKMNKLWICVYVCVCVCMCVQHSRHRRQG